MGHRRVVRAVALVLAAATAAGAQDLHELPRDELRAMLADPDGFDTRPAALLELSRRDDWTAAEAELAAGLLSSDDHVIVGCASLALGRHADVALPAAGRLADVFPPDPDSAEPPPPDVPPRDGPVESWVDLRGLEFRHAWRNIRGTGHGTEIRFVEHEGRRWARVVASRYLAAPPPTPRNPDDPAGPVAAPADFEPLSWTVDTYEVDVEDGDDGLEIRVSTSGGTARWRVSRDGRTLELDRPAGPGTSEPLQLTVSAYEALTGEVAQLTAWALRRVCRRHGDTEAVQRLLVHPSRAVRLVALESLGGGPISTEIALRVLHCTAHGRRVERDLAAAAFQRMGAGAGEALRQAVLSDDQRVRHAALQLAPRMGERAEPVAEVLAEWLIDGGPIGTYEVLRALGELGPHAAPATAALARFVGEGRRHHEQALSILARIGPAARDVALEIVLHVARTRPGFGFGRFEATRALAAIAPEHPELPGLIVACIQDPNDNMVEHALLWVTAMDPPPEGAVEAVMTLAQRKLWSARRAAAAALGTMGRGRKDVSVVLAAMVDDEHPWVQVVAAEALDAVDSGHPRVVPVLRRLLSHEDWNIRWHATMACERSGADVEALLPELRAHAADESEHGHVRRGARKAIAAIEAADAD